MAAADMRKDPAWRALAGAVAQKTEEQIGGRDSGDAEEKLSETLQPTQLGLPVEFVDNHAEPSIRLPGKRALISANARDVENFAAAPSRVCGTCRHFQLKEGRREIVKQGFLQRLVLEEDWKMSHLGAPADHLGVCGQNPQMVTSTVANAGTCSGYRARRG